ncbi:nucleolar zinc-finger protein [Tieghemiomyces parasiticus]|uniref:Nucleolar zinc-finger protein n=1 Tax=Tieghemiomyces parasiticus TaxID=78921 RepID=A0A9W8DVF4_9FUNG|nr:nucleolar zinc-finger protein [Tieghemiomyces parasiticus]
MAENEPLYVDIGDSSKPAEIESYCMSCGENGTTRILLTKVPHFREIILMAFECPHCGLKNNEVRSGGAIAEKGVRFECKVETAADLDRQLVKSDSALIVFKELDLEIPAKNGSLTTVEGIVSHAREDLAAQQPVRKAMDPAVYARIEEIIDTLRSYVEDGRPFTIVVDDPAGNSYIENLKFPADDPQLLITHYERSKQDNINLALAAADDDDGANNDDDNAKEEGDKEKEAKLHTGTKTQDADVVAPDEVITFPANCSSCNAPSETRMHMISIPHFKNVIIMSTACDHCGYKSNEVKSGGAISERGRRITLKLEDAEDLSRDILKSETCGLQIPEIDLELHSGTLGGRFTTVEGILTQVKNELNLNAGPFMAGDSSTGDRREKFKGFLGRLDDVIEGRIRPCTLILDDPLANSHLQNLYAPDPDPNMTIEDYDRTWDQNEDLGLNDVVLEGYEEAEQAKQKKEREEADKQNNAETA